MKPKKRIEKLSFSHKVYVKPSIRNEVMKLMWDKINEIIDSLNKKEKND